MTENEQLLLAGLKALAASDTSAPPPALEAALLKRLKPPKKIAWWPIALELAAALVVAALAIASRPKPRVAAEFMAVPYVEPLGPNERAEIVRVNVPVAALARWGYSVSALNPAQRVDAELVLGENGLAKAVRLITTD